MLQNGPFSSLLLQKIPKCHVIMDSITRTHQFHSTDWGKRIASGWASSYSRNCLPKYTSDQSGLRHRERTFRFPGFPLKFRWKTFSWGNYASEIFFGHFKIGASEASVLKRKSCIYRLEDIWFWKPTYLKYEKDLIITFQRKGLSCFRYFRPKCRDMKR